MTISFLPTSTFGVYGLSQLLESRGTYVVMQLLYVPPETPGDRTLWTWQNNWKNYAVAGAFSGTGGSLNLSTQGASPTVSSALYEEATSQFAGAYTEFDPAYPDGGYITVFNNSTNTYTYTHAAVFAMQGSITSPNNIIFDETSLYQIGAAYDFETGEATTATLAPYNSNLMSFFSSFTLAESFNGWVTADENTTEYIDPPYPNPFVLSVARNTQNNANVLDNYKTLLGISDADATTSFLAELLNVTGAEPDFEAGWSGWATYRINRYSTASFTPKYTYTLRSGEFVVTFEGIDYEIVDSGTELSYSNYTEFVFTPPTAGSFTFTHIAVFANEIDSPPQQGTTYAYPDTNKLVGVIKLPASVTMTTTSANRAYPFKFSYMYQMDQTITELGS